MNLNCSLSHCETVLTCHTKDLPEPVAMRTKESLPLTTDRIAFNCEGRNSFSLNAFLSSTKSSASGGGVGKQGKISEFILPASMMLFRCNDIGGELVSYGHEAAAMS